MKLEVVSKIGKSGCADIDLFSFLSDFNNIKKILPPEHSNKMQCTSDTCSISIDKYPEFALQIVERDAPKLVKIGSEQAGKDFFIWIQMKNVAPYDTRIKITLRTEMNMVMKMMAKKKLQQFVDAFVDGLCQIPPHALNYIKNS